MKCFLQFFETAMLGRSSAGQRHQLGIRHVWNLLAGNGCQIGHGRCLGSQLGLCIALLLQARDFRAGLGGALLGVCNGLQAALFIGFTYVSRPTLCLVLGQRFGVVLVSTGGPVTRLCVGILGDGFQFSNSRGRVCGQQLLAYLLCFLTLASALARASGLIRLSFSSACSMALRACGLVGSRKGISNFLVRSAQGAQKVFVGRVRCSVEEWNIGVVQLG